MASSYDNDLRLNEMATGDGSGTWGTTTNTNLALIAEAFSYGTEVITTNADTHTTTIADGATDPGRSLYLKYTGTLDSACTITIAPNDISKVWIIENGTSGSQNIIISQGSGATITIPAGDTKVVYSDGAGAGAAFVDAFASLSVVDLKVQDDLTVTDDASIGGDATITGTLGVTGNITGTLATAAQPNITSVGTLTGFTSTGIDDNATSTAITIDSSENVGIGTTSPSVPLEVNVSGVGDVFKLTRDTGTAGELNIDFAGANTNFNSEQGGFTFETSSVASAMAITAAGNVGIGTTSPAAPLSISGSSTGEYDALILRNSNAAASGQSAAMIFEVSSGTSGTEAASVAKISGLRTGSGSTGDLLFHTTNAGVSAEAMRIASSGNVGIGTASPLAKNHITGSGTSGQVTASWILQNNSSGTAGMDITGTAGASRLRFVYGGGPGTGTNSLTEAMSMGTEGTYAGRVGIGTSSPSETLEVNSRAKIGNITLAGNATLSTLSAGNATFEISTLTHTGGAGGLDFDIFLAITGGIQRVFQVEASGTGDTYTNDGTVSSLSDERVKTDIQDLTDGLEIVKQLRPVTFKYNDTSTNEKGHKLMGGESDKVRYGFIAQEVEAVAPQYVEYSTRKINNEEVNDFRNLSTTRMLPMLFKAVQEQQVLIEQLQAEVALLKG
jgi:hypothetical protein